MSIFGEFEHLRNFKTPVQLMSAPPRSGEAWHLPSQSGLSARCKYIRITMTTSLCSAWPISTGKVSYLAEQATMASITERLTAPDTLELIYVEAGHAAVYRAHLTPKK